MLGLLGDMVATRVLSLKIYGICVLIQIIASFLVRISSFGLHLAAPKFMTDAASEQDKHRLVNTVLTFRVLSLPILCVIAFMAKPALVFLFDGALQNDLFSFVLVFFLLGSLSQILKTVLQGFFLFSVMAKIDFMASVTDFCLTLLLVLWLRLGILGVVCAKATAIAISLILAYRAIPGRKRIELDRGLLKQLLRFGFPLQINDVLTFIFLRLDTLMIGALLGPAQLAYYEVARKIPEGISGLYEAFRSVFYPFIARFFALGERKQANNLLNLSTRLLSFLTMLGALIALLFGDTIIRMLFSDKYIPSVPIFMWLMIGLNFSFVDYTLGYTLVAVGESDKPSYINIVHTIISLLGDIVLIPWIGVLGAVLANLAGFGVANPLNVLFLRRQKIDIKIANYLKPISIFAVCWLLVMLLHPSTLLAQAAIVLCFCLACLLLSVITREELVFAWRELNTALAQFLGKPPTEASKVLG